VFFADPESRAPAAEMVLQPIYGLTPAEARVASLLARGMRVEEITERLSVSTPTVRTHVRRVLEKTDSRGQADLVRVLTSGPAALVLELDGAEGAAAPRGVVSGLRMPRSRASCGFEARPRDARGAHARARRVLRPARARPESAPRRPVPDR
jgi:DNA-binding CsgD family transcriptional regulator